ncbi:MAG: tRNA-dihydrouridine synthase family protein [Lachnospiraceae bacterium]|nr:tRNA-dihydrouridine synthase family protein [Lachnospiraceae bacterium]
MTEPQNVLNNTHIEQISFAPMEGITGRTFRKVHREFFPGVDKYYTPFLSANQTRHFKRRELNEFLPFDPMLIPQVLTSNADNFIWSAHLIADSGYDEVNINLGCPVATVVTKNKGSGMLKDKDRLKKFFEDVFAEPNMPRVSVKTRVGYLDPEEAAELGEIFAAYPICEVIIHPRVRTDFYKNTPNLAAFKAMKDKLSCKVCYNGDIKTPEDALAICKEFPDVHSIMIGRGLLADPSLADEIGDAEYGRVTKKPSKKEIEAFVRALWNEYSEILSGDRDVLFKMKELWFYLGEQFPEHQRELDKIKRCKTASEYHLLVKKITE